jgi:hypothetical protein
MAWLNNGILQGSLLASGAVLVWALALYVASRSPGRRVSLLAAAAMLCLAIYLMGEALGALAADLLTWADWLRRTWWAPSLALSIWLTLSLALTVEEGPQRWSAVARRALLPVSVISVGIGIVFAILGVLTFQLQIWTNPFVVGDSATGVLGARHVPAATWLPAFQLFALLCLVWPALNLFGLWQTSPSGSPLRARFAWLFASALTFLLGGGWIVIASGVLGLVGLPGQLLLVIGMLILGWNMARYGALVAGEQVLGDFMAYAATTAAIVIVYGGVLLTLAPDYGWIERGLPLLLLVMTTHVLVDARGHLLQRVLYTPLLSSLSTQLRDLGNRVGRQPDELSALADVREAVDQMLRESAPRTDFRVVVEGALRHLNDLPALSEHALLFELPLRDGTPLEQASELRNALDQAIERLRPVGARPSPGSSGVGGWLHYLVLKEAYVDGRPNKQIMQRYALSESTFHRARRRAIDAVASDLASRRAAQLTEATPRNPSTSSGPTRSSV